MVVPDTGEDEDFEFDLAAMDGTYSKFVQDGNTLMLAGMSARDTHACRAEFLRQHLEQVLGLEAFLGCYPPERWPSEPMDGNVPPPPPQHLCYIYAESQSDNQADLLRGDGIWVSSCNHST